MDANQALEISNHVIRLRQLLAWDLATLRPHANNTFCVVRLQMLDANNTQLVLNTHDIEELISTLAAKEINWLENNGVELDKLLTGFKQTGARILGQQESETPLDKPAGT